MNLKQKKKMKKKKNNISLNLKSKFTTKNRALQFIALFFIIQNLSFANILSSIDNKYIWVNKESLIDTIKIDSVLSFVEKNNIENIFFQVRARGDALYESQIVPKFEKIDNDFDPLNYVLEKTKDKNIKVHAWFNTYMLWSSPQIPKDSLHFYFQCSDCFATDFNGKSDSNIKLNQIQSLNWEGVYLSPLNNKVNKHILLVIDELINTYDIDGLHLDYVRFQDMFYGYNKTGIKEFENKHNFNPKDIDRGLISPRFGYLDSEVDSLTKLWDDYKTNSITNLVKDINTLVKNNDSSIKLSVAVKPNIIEAKYRWSQDWLSWVKLDLIDFAVVMNYESNINKFNFNNRLIKNSFSNLGKQKIVIGISTFNQNAIDAADKIILSRLNGFSSYSLYNYNEKQLGEKWYDPVINVFNFNIE